MKLHQGCLIFSTSFIGAGRWILLPISSSISSASKQIRLKLLSQDQFSYKTLTCAHTPSRTTDSASCCRSGSVYFMKRSGYKHSPVQSQLLPCDASFHHPSPLYQHFLPTASAFSASCLMYTSVCRCHI